MKNALLTLLLIAFIAVSSGFAQDKKVMVKPDAAKEAVKEVKKEASKEVAKEAAKSSKIFNTICPVSGEDTDNAITATYEGKTYALCCKRCLAKFQKDPAKYIKNLSEDGKKFIK